MSSKARNQISKIVSRFSTEKCNFAFDHITKDGDAIFKRFVVSGKPIISQPQLGDDPVENHLIEYVANNIRPAWDYDLKTFKISHYNLYSEYYFKSKILDFICENLENVVEPTRTTIYKYFRKRNFDDTEYEIWKYIMFHDKENEEQHIKNIMGLLKLIRKKENGGKTANKRRR